jgi:DNA-binding FadR family transcriptional regulator
MSRLLFRRAVTAHYVGEVVSRILSGRLQPGEPLLAKHEANQKRPLLNR